MSDQERRAFERLHAPVLCRPKRALQREVRDISSHGVRIYSDEEHRVGDILELDLFIELDAEPITCVGEIRWITTLGEDAPSRFDLGLSLRFSAPTDAERLSSFLDEG